MYQGTARIHQYTILPPPTNSRRKHPHTYKGAKTYRKVRGRNWGAAEFGAGLARHFAEARLKIQFLRRLRREGQCHQLKVLRTLTTK